jgi:hypothetical protein
MAVGYLQLNEYIYGKIEKDEPLAADIISSCSWVKVACLVQLMYWVGQNRI